MAYDPEEKKAGNAAYRAANLEKVKAGQKAWRAANPEKVKAKNAAYRAANPEKVKAVQRKRNYGITEEVFQKMLLSQRGICRICGVDFSQGVSPCVDHCHETGEIRGLLCKKCNAALGLLKDSVKNLERAKQYLTVGDQKEIDKDWSWAMAAL